jgi:hypothetical protein
MIIYCYASNIKFNLISFNTPILFLTFTHVDSDKRVFEEIKTQNPDHYLGHRKAQGK